MAQWKGPCVVQEKINDLNYLILVDGQPKRFHVNMLKKFYQPETAAGCMQRNVSLEMMKCLEAVRNHFAKPRRVFVRSDEMKSCIETVRSHFAKPQTGEVGAAVIIEEGADFLLRLG